MNARRLTCLASAAAIAVTGANAIGAPTAQAPPTITRSGVGKVKVGKTYKSLRKQKLLGKVRPGCELGGPNTRSASLRLPLKGSVDLTTTSPRKVRTITVVRGAAARGVGIGATTADIRAAFPAAVVDQSTDDVFGITLVKIPKSGGGRIAFTVDTTTKLVTSIGIPSVAFCE
jgi:hypothetical protein